MSPGGVSGPTPPHPVQLSGQKGNHLPRFRDGIREVSVCVVIPDDEQDVSVAGDSRRLLQGKPRLEEVVAPGQTGQHEEQQGVKAESHDSLIVVSPSECCQCQNDHSLLH